MELSQQKKQIIFKTCFIILLFLIVSYLGCLIFDKIATINHYKTTFLNNDNWLDFYSLYYFNVQIMTVDAVKYALYAAITLSLILHLFINKKYIKLISIIQLALFISVFSVLNVISSILNLVYTNSYEATHLGSNLTFVVILLFAILIVGLLLLIPQIIKEVKLLKNKSSSDSSSES